MVNFFNPVMAGVAGGIIGAIILFLTTLFGLLGISKTAKLLETTIWKRLGYNVSVSGLIWGTVLGFIYGFVIWWIFAIIYNSII